MRVRVIFLFLPADGDDSPCDGDEVRGEALLEDPSPPIQPICKQVQSIQTCARDDGLSLRRQAWGLSGKLTWSYCVEG